MAAWTVEFYEDETGCPLRTFLDGLEVPRRAKVIALIKLLEEQGATLPFPYSSQVEGKLRELRAHYGDEHYRILYYGAPDRALVLLHAFVKRARKTPSGNIRIAKERMRRSSTKKQERRQ